MNTILSLHSALLLWAILYGTGMALTPPQLVKDIVSGNGSSAPYHLTAAGSTVFFVAADGSHGYELWKTDGTADGTMMVKDILPGSASSAPSELVAVGSQLFFTASDGNDGLNLWTSDGTTAGTVMLQNDPSSQPHNLTRMGGVLYFTRTYQVTVLPPEGLPPGSPGSQPVTTITTELWRSDGTVPVASSQISSDPMFYPPSGMTLKFSNLVPVGNTLYFTCLKFLGGSFNPPVEDSLWKSDGTAAGTSVVTNFMDQPIAGGWSNPVMENLTAMGSTLYFQAPGTPTPYGAKTYALWRSNGTQAGTSIVKENTNGFHAGPIVSMTDHLYFAGTGDNFSTVLWQSDGTETGTVPALGGPSGGIIREPYHLTPAGTRLYFSAYNSGIVDHELWMSDGTVPGTTLVKDIRIGAEASNPAFFMPVGESVYFLADDGIHGAELWQSNGIAAGTLRLASLAAGPAFTSYGVGAEGEFLAAGSKLYFVANTTGYGNELYVYDTAQPAPEIVVEQQQPVDTNVNNGGSCNFGNVSAGADISLSFTIRNIGNDLLTGLAITEDGPNSADFTITAGPTTTTLPGPNGSTAFTVRFAPSSIGAKTAAIHLANNDIDENPFNLTLTGFGAVGTLVVGGDAGQVVPTDPANWTEATTGSVGLDSGKTGTIAVAGGRQLTSMNGLIGCSSGASGAVTVMGAGSTWTNGSSLSVGATGNGTLLVKNGGMIHSDTNFIGHHSGSTGVVTVTGTGSLWLSTGNLQVGDQGTATLNIADSGRVVAKALSINNGSSVNLHIDGNDVLVLGDATTNGILAIGGTINLYANGSLSAGTYTPISGFPGHPIVWDGTGAVKPFGGTWNAGFKTFTVPPPISLTAGESRDVDSGARLFIDDPGSGKQVSASFGTVPADTTFAATMMTENELDGLALEAGGLVRAAWKFTTNFTGGGVRLSFDIGSGLENLKIWHIVNGVRTQYPVTDLSYGSDGIVSFTVTGFSGYAVTAAAVPYAYTINNGTLTITGYNGPGGVITIPDKIDGLAVGGIGNSAFAGCNSLRSVTIPSGVTQIGDEAFAGCSGLTSACFTGSAPAMGTGAFDHVANGFKVYFVNGKTGFTQPVWNGYPTATMADPASPLGIWLFANSLPYSTNLLNDPNGDGVNLLMAYALNLDPNRNLSGSLPQPKPAGNLMRLTFYAGRDDVTYRVESCADLHSWSTAQVTLSTPDAISKERTASVNIDGHGRFMRLVVTAP